MIETTACPCKSGRSYNECCKPFLTGMRAAPTAIALMRSRYTAYALAKVDYLLKTWHPSTRPITIAHDAIPQWCNLQIIRMENGTENDTQGLVEFKASAISGRNLCHLKETSHFVKEGGQWFYINGNTTTENQPANTVNKIGRNEPCPCGSGKKSKRCCFSTPSQ